MQIANQVAYAVQASDDAWLFIGVTAIVAMAGLALYVKALRRMHALTGLPRSLLRSAAQGYVELHGFAQRLPERNLLAPLTHRACVWYAYRIEKRSRSSKGRTEWSTVEQGTSGELFGLQDTTGRAIINPSGSEVETHHRNVWHGDTLRPFTGPEPQSTWLSSGDYRYTERRINHEDPLFVWGQFRTHTVSAMNGGELTSLLREWKTDQARLIKRFDANGDGRIDVEEWEQVRAAAEQTVAQRRFALKPQDSVHLLTQPTDDAHPYLISTRGKDELLQRFRRRSWAGIALFVLSGAACVWLTTAKLAA